MYGLSQEDGSVTRTCLRKVSQLAERKLAMQENSTVEFPANSSGIRIAQAVVSSNNGSLSIIERRALVIMKTLKIMTVAAMLAAFFAAVAMVSATSRTAATISSMPPRPTRQSALRATGKRRRRSLIRALPDEQLIDAVMKGKKPEKPPNMPAYGEKGVTAEQAKALVEHMKQLKSAP